eukprot:3131796-Rhodomonas_salina.3
MRRQIDHAAGAGEVGRLQFELISSDATLIAGMQVRAIASKRASLSKQSQLPKSNTRIGRA